MRSKRLQAAGIVSPVALPDPVGGVQWRRRLDDDLVLTRGSAPAMRNRVYCARAMLDVLEAPQAVRSVVKPMNHSEIVGFPWAVADLIRDTFRRGKYQDVILPLTVGKAA